MRRIIFLFLLCSALIAGCSGGGTPVSPRSDDNIQDPASQIENLPVIGLEAFSDGTFQALGLLGAYEMTINPSTSSAELVAKRFPSLGQSFIVSGIGFFTIAPCSDCLRIKSISLTPESYLQLTFVASHPFKKGNLSNPPSAINRLDLDVFDLALVISPLETTGTNYSLTGTSAYTGILVNNAGYTTELSGVTGDNTAFPYALVIDDSISGTSTWNKFEMGTTEKSFDVFFDLDHLTNFSFDMFLTMGYGASAQGKSQRLNPTYFNPEFNRKSAWKVAVTPPNGSDPPDRTNTWNDKDPTTLRNISVKVYDWQQGFSSIANPPVNPGDLAFLSDVIKVTMEIPGMNDTLNTATTPTSGSGTPSDPLIYDFQIANDNLLAAGEYFGLVKVTDERVPGTIPPTGTIDYLIDSPDGITLINYQISEFATYQTFLATVVVGNLDPVASAIATTPTGILAGQAVTFDASASSDPDGTITAYEWDFNEDGIFAGTGDEYTGDAWNPSHTYQLGDGSWNVQLRVTDNLNATDQLDSPLVVTVGQSKNKVLRTGVTIWDIATIESTNEVLVLYSDRRVYKYNSTLSTGSQFYLLTSYYTNATTGVIEATSDGYSVVNAWPHNTYGWISQRFTPTGTLVTNTYYGWNPGLQPNINCAVYIPRFNDGVTNLNNYICWMGPRDPAAVPLVYGSSYSIPPYNNGYYIAYPVGSGAGQIDFAYIKGGHCVYNQTETSYVMILEGAPEYRIERGTYLNNWNASYAIGGIQTNDNTGFWDPRDITNDTNDRIYILDVLSTGERRIKMFNLSGTSVGSYGDNTSMSDDPQHIEACFGNNWIYVSMNNTVSIFFPTELP